MATNSASVELFVLSFCFVGAEYVTPYPKLTTTPVWLLMSGCMAYELSTHHFGSALGPIVKILCISNVMHLLVSCCRLHPDLLLWCIKM